jgi:hypothetical protein
VADSNSPAHWSDGKIYVFTSVGMPIRSEGYDQFSFRFSRAVLFDQYDRVFRWIESTWQDYDGTLYAWYHYEPGGVCEQEARTAPQIGALVSYDNGLSFYDLGIVLRSGDEPNCDAANGYFAGGHGDFSVVLDRERKYFYFFFGNYGGDPARQGVAAARMSIDDLAGPVGKVWKYSDGDWNQPGLDGMVSPIFPVTVDWGRADTDALWGPSVHFNLQLNRFVMLLTRSCCSPGWPPDGIYISFSGDLSEPGGWTSPQKILEGVGWYPQVLGLAYGETDKVAGQWVRLYVGGVSEWILEFNGTPDLDVGPVDTKDWDGTYDYFTTRIPESGRRGAAAVGPETIYSPPRTSNVQRSP